VHVDELGFTLVDPKKVAYKEDPFIMAYQAKSFLRQRFFK